MKLGHIMSVAKMEKVSFDTFNRRGHLSFLAKDVGDGVSRFNVAHALALAAFMHLRRLGLEPASANIAVSDSWFDICRVAGIEEGTVKSKLCGVRINHIGLIDSWGWPRKESSSGEAPLASAAVDLDELWKDVQIALSRLEDA